MLEGEKLPTVERQITQGRIDKYASASGDFNPIHVDPEFAATTEFGGTIAHGMMVAAMISHTMTLAFNSAWLAGGRLKLKFRTPVFPGDTVTTFGEVQKVREVDGTREVVCSVGVRKQSGEEAITGEATVAIG